MINVFFMLNLALSAHLPEAIPSLNERRKAVRLGPLLGYVACADHSAANSFISSFRGGVC
jgi:hypothetical protein